MLFAARRTAKSGNELGTDQHLDRLHLPLHSAHLDGSHVQVRPLRSSILLTESLLIYCRSRYSSVQARRMFLTNYYDAFNSDLYLHLSRPDTLRRAISIPSASSFTSSLSSMVKTLPQVASRLGWPGAFTELWGNVTSLVVEWAMPLPEANASWESWPPT